MVGRRSRAQVEAAVKAWREMPHAKAAGAFFASTAGQALMAHLEKKFVFGDLLGETADQTAFNLGAREVVMELRVLRDLCERTGTDVQEKPQS